MTRSEEQHNPQPTPAHHCNGDEHKSTICGRQDSGDCHLNGWWYHCRGDYECAGNTVHSTNLQDQLLHKVQ